MSKPVLRLFIVATWLLALLLPGTAAMGGGYVFENVADTTGPFMLLSGIAINDNSDVAFFGNLDSGGSGIFRGPNPATDTVADRTGPFNALTHTAINNSGTVVFHSTLDAGGEGFYTGPNPGTDVLVATGASYSSFERVRYGYNDLGTLAFQAIRTTGEEGIFIGPNPATDTIADDTGPYNMLNRPWINNVVGEILFLAGLDAGGEGIFTGPNPGTDTFVDSTGPFESFGGPMMNDSGTIVFPAHLDTGIGGIYTGPNPVTHTFVEDTGPYSIFSGVSINNSGQIMFLATLDAGGHGIFTGPDPDLDKIIRTGDALFGSTATLVTVSRDGFNNNGEIAFRYFLDNGVDGVAIAAPAEVAVTDTLGNWQLNDTDFFDSQDPNTCFGLATLDIDETAIDRGPYDLEITVTGIPIGGSKEIEIDKRILNGTGLSWDQVTMALGSDLGANFIPSNTSDDLHFIVDPKPQEVSGALPSLVLDDPNKPDTALFEGGILKSSDAGSFCLGIHVPDLGQADGMATFTLRQLAQYAPLAGDFDFDFDVDGFDFLEWQRGFGTIYNAADLADWEANYGTVAPLLATAAAVPEPATFMMLLIGMLALHFRRDVFVA